VDPFCRFPSSLFHLGGFLNHHRFVLYHLGLYLLISDLILSIQHFVNAGVYPVYNLKFKIGTKGRDSDEEDMKVIKDMETFSPSIDENIEEWTPIDTDGWVRKLMTGKGFTIALNDKRHEGDPGNDYVAAVAWKDGLDCSSKAEIEFPNGDKLEFNCVVSVTTPFGGDTTDVSSLEVELHSDGKPTYTPAA